ncbi:hypothetical protein NP233_g7156 [Leucocoprinus birnbaumii]|uniref:Uncharacterized protein n=1 Tax=Leucocoprinus birnbaumii TaxID=56174 RepID=A0AAD5VPW2_9AGAR|nr:hypothetical protein NP233_g7156 [Leucocoprinus birnbaumii]
MKSGRRFSSTCKRFYEITQEHRQRVFFKLKKLDKNYGYRLVEEQGSYSTEELEELASSRNHTLNAWLGQELPNFQTRSVGTIGEGTAHADYKFLPGGRWIIYSASRRDPTIFILDLEAAIPMPQDTASLTISRTDKVRTCIFRVRLCGHDRNATFDVQLRATFEQNGLEGASLTQAVNDSYVITLERWGVQNNLNNPTNSYFRVAGYDTSSLGACTLFDWAQDVKFIHQNVFILISGWQLRVYEVVDFKIVMGPSITLGQSIPRSPKQIMRSAGSEVLRINVGGRGRPLIAIVFHYDCPASPTMQHCDEKQTSDMILNSLRKGECFGISSSVTLRDAWISDGQSNMSRLEIVEFTRQVFDVSTSTAKKRTVPFRFSPSPLPIRQIAAFDEETGRLLLTRSGPVEFQESGPVSLELVEIV